MTMGYNLEPDQVCRFLQGVIVKELTGNYWGETKQTTERSSLIPHGVGVFRSFTDEILIGNFESGDLNLQTIYIEINLRKKYAGIFYDDVIRAKTYKFGNLYIKNGPFFTGMFE